MVQKVYTEAETEQLHETVIKRHMFFPFWTFADLMTGAKEPIYWCFLGANYPAGLVSMDQDQYNEAVELLTSGRWLLQQKADNPNKDAKIGFGWDETPSKAFVDACRMAGVIKNKA